MKKHYDLRTCLEPYIPEEALDEVVVLLEKYPIHLGLMAPRRGVFGDYRPPQIDTVYHKITVNGDLNRYAFLITFLHEYAHLEVFANHGPYTESHHGNEWKKRFRCLLNRHIELNAFPSDVCFALRNYMIKVPASTATDPRLMRALEHYDTPRPHLGNEIAIETLPLKALFLYNDQLFEKGEHLRKNYICVRVSDKAKYKFHPLTKVVHHAFAIN